MYDICDTILLVSKIKQKGGCFMKKLYILLSALILSSVAPLYASYCIHCGKNLPDEANFCSNCGQAVYNANTASTNYIPVSSNNNLSTTKTKVVYSDGVRTTSTVKTVTAYTPNTDTQIVYKNEYYYPVPVTNTVVVREEPVCDPLLGLMIWGVIRGSHHHHHHRHVAPPVRHMPPPRHVSRAPHHGIRRAGFRR